jgi:microcystin degradation protein MlrC
MYSTMMNRREFLGAVGTMTLASATGVKAAPPAARLFRVAVGGLVHETNTYVVEAMGPTTLEQFTVLRGSQIPAECYRTGTSMLSLIEACREADIDIVPTVYAIRDPSGTITAQAYNSLKSEILQSLRRAGSVDAVLLDLHGAGVAENVPSIEADLLTAIRRLVGQRTRIIWADADLHGNPPSEITLLVDFWNGVQLYPHTDYRTRARRAVQLVPNLVAGKIRPTMQLEWVPILMPLLTTDPGSLAAQVKDKALAIESRAKVLDCTVFHGFPFADVPQNGIRVLVTTDNDQQLAQQYARELAQWIWDNREQFRWNGLSAAQAVEQAIDELKKQSRPVPATAKAGLTPNEIERQLEKASYGFLPDEGAKGPVVIHETSDNPGAGTTGDATHLPRAMLEAGLEQAAFAGIYDPETVEQAVRAGVGGLIDIRLGGKAGTLGGRPIEAKAYVKSISDGRATMRGMDRGAALQMGPSAGLIIGGMDVIVTRVRQQTFDNALLRLHGVDVRDYRIIGLKSAVHFRAWWRDVASRIITADPPGYSTNNVGVFKHTRKTCPRFPIDADATYPVKGA